MSKIERLTSEQKAMLAIYRDKWIKIGLCTDPINRDHVHRICRDFYIDILERDEPIVIIMPSPMMAWLATCLLSVFHKTESQVGDQVGSQVGSQVESQVWDQVESQVWSQVWSQVESQVRVQVESQVWDQVRSQVWDQVRSQVGDQVGSQVGSQVEFQVWDQVESQVWDQVWDQVEFQVWSQVESQVWSQVESQVWSQVRSQVRSQVESQVRNQSPLFVWPYQDGQWFASVFSFYSFMIDALGISIDSSIQKRYKVWEATANMGPIWALDKFCVVSDRPIKVSTNEHGLHCDGEPAVLYRDGFSVWALNGVRVLQEVAETPAEELDCQLIAKESNVEIRRELVRKIGLTRIFKDLNANLLHEETHTALDVHTMQTREHHYRLLTLDLGENITGYGLEMTNPSTGDSHVEFVPPNCLTVGDALKFRNGTSEFPKVLS